MRSKKTLLITFDFPPQATGIGTYLYNIWRNLSVEDNFILAPRVKGWLEYDAALPLKVFRYPNLLSSRIVRTVVLLFISLYFVVIKKVQVIFCSVPVSQGLIGLIFKKIFNLSFGVFYYGGEYSKFKDKKIVWLVLKTTIKNADFVITISGFSKEEAVRFGALEARIFKVTPAVDTAEFRPGLETGKLKKELGIEGKKVLLTVARLVKRKGVHLAIEALAELKKVFPELIYLVVGTGEEEGNLKKQAREKGLEKEVIFLGYAPQGDLPFYYNLCDIYLMPNTELKAEDNVEGFGISFIEASSCAKPVIGGISGGVKDAVVDAQTGLLIDPEDPGKLIEAISRLLKDEDYARELGRNGRLRAEEEFNWATRSRQLELILEKRV